MPLSSDLLDELSLEEEIASNGSSHYALNIPPGFKLVFESFIPKPTIDPEKPYKVPKLPVFNGESTKVSIENWLRRFEMISNYFKWNDQDRVMFLGNYLEGDALNWYMDNLDSCPTWGLIKNFFTSRFGAEATEPIIEFIELKYDHKTGIKEYFEKKRRLGVLAKLTEEQIIPLMVHELTPRMAEFFVANKPKTYAQFYHTAQKAEEYLKRRLETTKTFLRPSQSKFVSKTPSQKPHPNHSAKPTIKPIIKAFNTKSDLPKNPCYTCQKLNISDNLHWSKDCPIKKKQLDSLKSPSANLTEKEDFNIKKINLN